MSFDLLGLSDELLKAVDEAGYSEPTPIQKQAIPPVLMGQDVLGIAQTGTGKTASFVLPMLDILAQGRARARMPRSLILEPTRELAAQVAENFEKYGKHYNLSMALIIGGVSFADQMKLLDRGVDVLIATPGRLLDQFERGNVMLTGVDIFVIDEADRMMDMGFIPDVERIGTLMAQKHQTLFFSATMPPAIKRLTDKFLKEPKIVEVARPAQTATTVAQFYAEVAPRDKRMRLRDILDDAPEATAIVFCNRKRDVSILEGSLKKHGYSAGQLHGDMDQPARMAVLEKFKAGDIKVLAASDVAARGLDIPSVSLVVNFDVPMHPDDYVHRIGRTGRAGRSGKAITFVSRADQENWDDVVKLINLKVEKLELAPAGEDDPTPAQPKSVAAEPRKPAKAKGRRGKSRGAPDLEEAVVGLGDHVPDFLRVELG
ncbi:MAG: DEAD/DEAH box helicase [Pseudomonadota bacterium]